MTATAHQRGNKIYYDGTTWRYTSDKTPIATEKPCVRCGQIPTPEGHDACLGHIEGAISVCCGHGIEEPYTVYAKHREYSPLFLALLILPDRVALDPITDDLAAKYNLRHGQRLPFSSGWVVEARPGSIYEKLIPTEWRWVSDVVADLDGRMVISGAAVIAELPVKKTGYQAYRGLAKRRRGRKRTA